MKLTEKITELLGKVNAVNEKTNTATTAAIEASNSRDTAIVKATEASNSAMESASAKNIAITKANEASINANYSQLRKWEAEAEKKTANSYANENEDVKVKEFHSNGDGTFSYDEVNAYSSKHWRIKATNISGGALLLNNNLSDIGNPQTARNNLNIYSTTEVDTLFVNSTHLKKPTLNVESQTISSDYITSSDFIGTQTASNWYIFEADGVTLNHTSLNDTIKLTSYTLDGLSANTSYIVKKENISGNFKSKLSNGVTILTPNKSISTPTSITVEGSPASVPEKAETTLTSLPTSEGCTINKVEFKCIRTEDSVQIGATQSTSNLGLPIKFNTPDGLEVGKEYRWMWRCLSLDNP